MPKKINGQGTLYSNDEYKMFLKVDDGFLIPTGVKKISAEQFNNIQTREGGYFLQCVERKLEDSDLDNIKERLRNDESRPVIMQALGITETTLANFLQKHFGSKKINDARLSAKMEKK